MNTKLQHLAAIALGVPMVIFGANKFLLFANVPPPTDPAAQMFLGAMFTSYLAKLVGFFEILGGGLTLLPSTRKLGWLTLAPIMVNIVVFHFAHDMPGNLIWLFSTVAFVLVTYNERSQLKSILVWGSL